jgi:hypothetical protein
VENKMPKDTTMLGHADYVYGVASLNTMRHAALMGQTSTRKQRRQNMTAFRANQVATQRQDAARAAAIAAMPVRESKPASYARPKPGQPLDLHAAQLHAESLAAIERAKQRDVTTCPIRGQQERDSLNNWLTRFAPHSAR